MKKQVKLGIFFAFTVVVLVIGILVFGKIRIASGAYRFYIDYDFTGDLRRNGKVRYRGGSIDIGYVESIKINENGTLRVEVVISEADIKLPLDTEFIIQTVGFGLGEKYILVNSPIVTEPGVPFIVNGQVVNGVNPGSIEDTIGKFGELGEQISMDDINMLIVELKNTVHTINNIIVSNEQVINDVILDVNTISSDIKKVSQTISQNDEKINSIISNADSTLNTFNSVAAIIDNDKEKIPSIISNLEAFSEKIQKDPSTLLFSK